MKEIIKKIKLFFLSLKLYLKYKEVINFHYERALKEGSIYNENYNWIERTIYWIKCLHYD